ncbi:uncharacterized protein EKO05_0003274 [Ascochyta rabiei]|uniref:Uncharacterized protein n=1 Tax=Didymella rabiei TaxID=5454 RepID=A0A163IAA3_DIDRA|nr:uncharacterized protein EKO05_0003274 [Ascochyta rabiei]KZM25669.1 hypothetical protein ST47_g3213 [Ascochyta rabiei]UPX12736.1 hypothetical protein EKO05_0003274 [Ascochyta rabiei]
MLLLDLPPEIFQRIVAFYVSNAGIRKAAKIRGVSKTFRDYINEEMFARQHASAFVSKVPRKLLQKNVALFLEYRSMSLYGAPDLLPSLIHRAVDHMVEVTNKTTDKERAALTQGAITVVSTHCDGVHHLAVAPTQLKTRNYLHDAVDVTSLSIAIYLGKKGFVSQLLDRKINHWGRTHLFGSLLCVAAKQNDIWSLRRLLSTMTEDSGGLLVKSRSNIIIEALDTAAHRKHWSVAVVLFKWHIAHISVRISKHYGSLLKLAAASDGLSLLREIPCHNHVITQRALLIGLLKNPAPKDVLHHCVGEKGMRDWLEVRCDEMNEARSLLDLAVREDNLALVEATVYVQAQVDGARLYATLSTAFREAILRNNDAMVRFFLKNGVDPEAPIHPRLALKSIRPPTSTCDLARPGSKVYSIVREAIVRKMEKLQSKYQSPEYYVWSKELQEDVLMSYTFHAPKL